MRFGVLFLILSLQVTLLAGDWVLPWMANRDAQWASEIVINNHSTADAMVTLQAVRPDGSSQTAEVMLPATAQQVFNAGELFSALGSGSGYAVFISSENDSLTAAVRVASLNTASGFSASMGEAIPFAQTADQLLYPLIPAEGFAGVVVVNPSDQVVNATVAAYTAHGSFGEPVTLSINPRTPISNLVSGDSGLFPNLAEPAYLLVQADGPLAGAEFYFNDLLEPSMINALANVAVDETLLNPLFVTLETMSTVNQSMDTSIDGLSSKTSSKMDCPDSNVNVNITEPESLITANLDWGTGCTNRFGVYHAGSIDLNFQRQGSLLSGGWMNGSLSFNQFQTKYLGSTASINGTTIIQADTDSKNFSWTGKWQASADTAIYGTASSMSSNVALLVNGVDDNLIGTGSVNIVIDTYYDSSIQAFVDPADPLVYNYDTCIWPASGRIDFEIDYANYTYRGYVDFGTGDCNTATVSLRGVSSEFYLPGLYGQ